MQSANFVIVYSTAAQDQAEAVRQLLRADGIPCRLAGILRGRAPALPTLDIQVQVPCSFVSAARQLIATQDRGLSLPSLALPPPVTESN